MRMLLLLGMQSKMDSTSDGVGESIETHASSASGGLGHFHKPRIPNERVFENRRYRGQATD